VLIIFSKHDSCTKPEPLIEPRHQLFSLALDEKRTSSNTSTWLLYTCTSEVLVKFPGYSSHKTGLSYRAASSRPRRRRKLAEGAASMPWDAPPADDAAPLRLAAPTAACAGELHPLGQFRQSQSTGLAPPADTAASPSARPRPLPGRSDRRVRRAAWSDRTHAQPRHQAHASPPPQKAVRLGRRVVCSLPNPRCSPDMALCSSHRAACDAPAHLCTCNHVTLMHNPALPKCSLYQLACCQTKHQCSIPLPPTNLRQIWATQSTSAESSAALSSPREDHKTLDANVLEWTSNEEGNRKRM